MKSSSRWIKRPLALLALLSLSALAQAQGSSYQVRAKQVYTGDGTRLENAVVLVRDGKIVKVGTEIDSALPLFEHAGVLTAGLVACQSRSGTLGADDRTRSVLSEARIADSVARSHSDFERALAAGITSMVLAPTGANLSGGISTVVKTVGAKPLKREGHLAISFSNEALGVTRPRPRFFFGQADAETDSATKTESGGPENTVRMTNGERLPTSYPGAKRMLHDLLNANKEGDSAFARAARGELPVMLEAWDRNEVMRAAAFAKEFSLKGAVRGAPLGADPTVSKALKESGLGVIVGPFVLGQARRSMESAGMLAEAGIPLAFALDAPLRDPAGFRMTAAMVVGAGGNADMMLRSLTSVAATLAGVGNRVGSIKAGMDADFVLWSGHPVNLASSVQAVYVDGKLAFSQKKKDGQAQ